MLIGRCEDISRYVPDLSIPDQHFPLDTFSVISHLPRIYFVGQLENVTAVPPFSEAKLNLHIAMFVLFVVRTGNDFLSLILQPYSNQSHP